MGFEIWGVGLRGLGLEIKGVGFKVCDIIAGGYLLGSTIGGPMVDKRPGLSGGGFHFPKGSSHLNNMGPQ